MQHLFDNLTDPRDHLALDEAMLLAADSGDAGEAMRIWELARHVCVAGRATRVEEEIDIEFCERHGIEILRRCSGGASVVAGPGCLMYSVVLNMEGRGELRKIDVAHRYVMQRVLRALRQQLPEAEFNGTCDLTWNDRKCSGNSLRVARSHLLYHGTLLYDFELPLIGRCLKVAPRQPDYRQGRDHHDFVANAPIEAARFAADLAKEFEAVQPGDASSLCLQMAALRKNRYDDQRWHFRH